MEIYNPDKLFEDIEQLEDGESKIRAYRQAAEQAEREHDYENEVWFHHELIRSAVFSGDRLPALVDFPQYLRLVNLNDELKEQFNDQMLWVYKWMLQAIEEFYQISKADIKAWYSQFRRELLKAGYSLQAYYNRKVYYDMYADPHMLRIDFEKLREMPLDYMSDGADSLLDDEVEICFELNQPEKAMECAKKRIENGGDDIGISFTYRHIVRYGINSGKLNEVEKYAKILRHMIDEFANTRYYFQHIGTMMKYYALTEPEKGMELYEKYSPLQEGYNNPQMNLYFDMGAIKTLYAAGEIEKAKLIAQRVTDISAKFDARNGTDYYLKQCNFNF